MGMYICLEPAEPKEGVRSQGTGVKDSVSHHAGANNQSWGLWNSRNCS